ALSRLHDVEHERPAPRERSVGERAGYPVRSETSVTLIAAEGGARDSRETPVDRASRKAVPAEPKLEHRDVPAARTDRELALSETWAPARSERAACGPSELAVRAQPVPALERDERMSRQRATYAVDGTGIEPVCPKGDLQRRHLGTRRQAARCCDERRGGQREANDGKPAHARRFAVEPPHPPRFRRSSTLIGGPAGGQGYNVPLLSPVAQLAEHPAVNR